MNLAFVYEKTDVLDSALYYSGKALKVNPNPHGLWLSYMLGTLGDEYFKLKNYKTALYYYQKAYDEAERNVDFRDISTVSISLSKYYVKTGKPDSGIYYAQQALSLARKASYNQSVYQSADLLARLYDMKHQADSGFKYLKLSSIAKDSLYNAAKSGEVENLTTNEFLRRDEIQAAQTAYQNRLRVYALISVLLIFLIAALLQWRNSRQRKKAYILLQKQKDEIEEQRAQAQIEAALEKVRSRSLAMHKTDELQEVVNLVFDKLMEMGVVTDSITLSVPNRKARSQEVWIAVNGVPYPNSMLMTYHDDPINNAGWEAWDRGMDYFSKVYSFEEKNQFFKWAFEHSDLKYMPAERKNWVLQSPAYACSFAFGKISAIWATSHTGKVLGLKEGETLKRFAKVFEQAYIRFLDLQKAEAQAREAKIEAALERVRARVMAMHSSGELIEVANVLREQMGLLGQPELEVSAVHLYNDDSETFNSWYAVLSANDKDGKIKNGIFTVRKDCCALIRETITMYRSPVTDYTIEASGEKMQEWFEVLLKAAPELGENARLGNPGGPKTNYFHHSDFGGGSLVMASLKEPSEEVITLQRRAASVFDLAYRRFLDLKQAEAQAREAQIELGLERVRARAMAMQRSEELPETSFVLFQQFKELGANAEQISIGIINEAEGVFEVSATLRSGQLPQTYKVAIDEPFVMAKIYRAWKAKEKSLLVEIAGKELYDYNIFRSKLSGIQFNKNKTNPSDRYIINASFFSKGLLSFATDQPAPIQTIHLLERFAGVFDSTYTRFLDLKQAEEQAREAKIEAALERVRSRTMAMQKSEELKEVIQLVYEQLKQLNFNIDSANFALDYKESDDFNLWLSSAGQSYPTRVHSPYIDIPIFNRFIEAKKNGVDFLTENYSFEEKNAFFDHFFKNVQGVTDERKEFVMGTAGYARSTVLMKNVTLSMQNYAAIPYSEEENAALRRFGNVFEQTYTRFLDLQQAEAQAREAKIEAGLERVRAKAMSMQTSEELNELIGTVFAELTKLDVALTRCLIMIFDEETKDSRWWMANSEAPEEPMNYHVQYHKHPANAAYLKAWKERVLKWRYDLKGKVKKAWDDFLFVDTELAQLPKPVIEGMKAPARVLLSASFNNFGCLTLVSLEPLSDEHFDLLLRFAKVFDMSYTRFNDLKQAEAQAREARIEAALERVRSRTMAMHSSEDVADTVATMFDELVKLGIDKTVRSGIGILDDTAYMEVWTASSAPNGDVALMIGRLDTMIHPLLQGVHKAWKNKELRFTYELAGSDQKDYITAINNSPDYPVHFDFGSLPSHQFNNCFFFPEGTIFVFSPEQLTTEATQIFKRFAGVFGQTYRRYLDLQKAEAQARKAQIEASLEKVRAEAMAMHDSKDVGNATALVFSELERLGITTIRCGILIIEEATEQMEVWTATLAREGKVGQVIGKLDMNTHPLLKNLFKSWKQKKPTFIYELAGEELLSYYKTISNASDYEFQEYYTKYTVPDDSNKTRQYSNVFFFGEGALYAFTWDQFSPEDIQVMEKFAAVFSLTYRRYLDLKQAEEQAREAVKQASLDRVRAEIASMRSTNDLERITPLIWNELTHLGIPFIRCGVFIVDEERDIIHTYLSTPDGKALAVFNLQFDSEGIGQNVLPAWRKKQIATLHWTEEEFAAYTRNLVDQGTVKSQERYVTEHPDTSLDLHFLPFLQGMLYVGNVSPLTGDDMGLVQSLAGAFSTAYARYEDFNKLEAAKQQVDKTLTELKAAQTQLIQSEKMASLGELTAGIAHEIQNPLNFVNNFAEVNVELLAELKQEITAKNYGEVSAIADDIIVNEQKITLHGKRAGSIVKSMLEHSRSGSGQKEPTDLNALADEYMRLSYHGLRAKDKDFNAEMVTHFDPSLPKISVVQQDLGRVLLNLFNNAFYAAYQKAKTAGAGFKPEVSLTTSAENGQVVIAVKDNGVGIPDAIKNKIMQPFFTTKPTGEGTGLGLSLTYDMVVKGHGGSITVNSVEGEGSEFIVTLPVN